MLHAQIFGPGAHHRAVVDAVNDDFVDAPLFVQSVLKLEIGGDLGVRSGGSECSGETHEEDGLGLGVR
jgi:hypothetical protein